MNLSKAQLQAIGLLTKAYPKVKDVYMVKREKRKEQKGSFVSGVVTFDELGREVGLASVHNLAIDALERRGLIEFIASDTVNGALYKATEALTSNDKLIEKSLNSFGERATQISLQESAYKFGCEVLFDRTPRLFKVVRLDGRQFTKPFIDVSSTGVKVTRLTDLTIEEWEREIAGVILRSSLV